MSDAARRFRALVYGEEAVSRRRLRRAARRWVREATTPQEARHARRWLDATARGHRLKVATAEVEVLVGSEISAVKEAERFLGDDLRLAAALEELRREEST